MSKTRGNVIDPVEMVESYGADALRFTLTALAMQGRDVAMSEERVSGYRNFMNKLWNATRFCLQNLEGYDPTQVQEATLERELADRWILSRLQRVITEVRQALHDSMFSDAANTLYHFVWHECCDWYIELTKRRLRGEGPPKLAAQHTLATVLDQTLRLLHPIIPFITEELWQHLPQASASLVVAAYPQAEDTRIDAEAEADMQLLMDVVNAIRTIRGEVRLAPSQRVATRIRATHAAHASLLRQHTDYLTTLGTLSELLVDATVERPPVAATAVVAGMDIYVPLGGVIDIDKEKQRLEKDLQKLSQELIRTRKKLANPSFLERAPEEIVAKEHAAEADLQDKEQRLQIALERLQSLHA
jgi:valyl-tRNA synthetase